MLLMDFPLPIIHAACEKAHENASLVRLPLWIFLQDLRYMKGVCGSLDISKRLPLMCFSSRTPTLLEGRYC